MSKWVGETGKNIDAIFEEAKVLDCVSQQLASSLEKDKKKNEFFAASSKSGLKPRKFPEMLLCCVKTDQFLGQTLTGGESNLL